MGFSNGDIEVVKLLIEGQTGIVSWLLGKKGADVNVKDYDGNTALMHASMYRTWRHAENSTTA